MPDDLETYSNSRPGFDLVTYSTFHEEGGIATGDPYMKPQDVLPRYKGKQFSTGIMGVPRKGMAASQIGQQIPFTVPGDRYIEQAKLQQGLHGGGNGTGKPWVPNSGRNSISAPGALHGTFGPLPLLVDTDTMRRPGTAPMSLRNFTISPPRKGGPGRMIQDNTIGGTKFDYVPDEYCPGRRLEKGLKREARSRILKPFNGGGAPSRPFHEVPGLAATGADPYDPPRRRAQTAPSSPVWRPSNPPSRGPGQGTINKLEYVASGSRRFQHVHRYVRPFCPAGGPHSRLSLWTVNPYVADAQPPSSENVSLL